jgi:hypothetical protein
MPVLSTLRTPLKDLDVNLRRRGTELTPYERGRILGVRVAGMSPREIEVAINYSKYAITGTIVLEILRLNSNSLPRKGRLIIYNERDRRSMLRNIRSFLKLTFQ